MISIEELGNRYITIKGSCDTTVKELFEEETLMDLYSNALELDLTDEQLENYILIQLRDRPEVLLNVLRYKGDFIMDLNEYRGI